MYPFYHHYQIQPQIPSWYNQPYMPQSITFPQLFINPPYTAAPYNQTNFYHSHIKQDQKTFSDGELTNLLNTNTNVLKQIQAKDQQQQLPIITDVIIQLINTPKSILASTLQNEFFSLLRTPLTHVLHEWRSRPSSLSDKESFMLRIIVKLIRKINRAIDDIKLIPTWLSDLALLEAISSCLTDIAISGKFLDKNNKNQFKYFTRLIDAYTRYQQRLNDELPSQKDKLVQLLDPILHCLTSSHFIRTFETIPIDAKSMTTIQKFFLVKCPSFLTSYNGSRLESTMEKLLSNMLPRYVQLLDKLIPSAHKWKRGMIRSVYCLLRMMNHGADESQTNAKLVCEHLSIIDHVLKLVNQPIFYNNLHETLSNIETIFMDTAIRFLVNMINEPGILTHIKQCQVADTFLRLTSCKYEPLVFNVYTLLAYTTREEDIKAMYNPGRLLSTILKSLKKSLDHSSDNENHREQLLETLKGLVQHDQMKDEVMKQNALPFLFECADRLTDKPHILILEILWSLTFHEEGAKALRSNRNFLNKIQTISTNSKDEPLKKAADGLVWKLIRQTAFLEKVAQQEVEEQNAVQGVMETIIEEIINEKGEKQLITTIKPALAASGERMFQYDMMISYCHADKDLVYKIHKFLLERGLKIWIDLDNMYGPAMNAMADAVENSEFVIMCMSDSYKQSTYCQAEAEYAFNCKRGLLPLIVREGYRPDGWLGFMIGSRIYVDFGRFDFETACEKLMVELTHQRKRPLPSKEAKMTSHEMPTKTVSTDQKIVVSHHDKPLVKYDNEAFATFTRRKPLSNFMQKPIIQWTDSDVLDFLFTQRLIQLMPLCDTMDGRALIQLYKMGISRSNRTFALLNNELQSTYKMKLPLRIFTRFLAAIEQRLSAHPPTPFQPISKLPVTMNKTFQPEPVSYPPRISYIQDAPPAYPSYPSRISYTNNVLSPYPSYSSYPEKPYDMLITSNASPVTIIRGIQKDGPNYFRMSSVLA